MKKIDIWDISQLAWLETSTLSTEHLGLDEEQEAIYILKQMGLTALWAK